MLEHVHGGREGEPGLRAKPRREMHASGHHGDGGGEDDTPLGGAAALAAWRAGRAIAGRTGAGRFAATVDQAVRQG